MHRLANGNVFVLNAFADNNAGRILFPGFFRNVCEIIIEDDFGSPDPTRHDQVRVHDAFVPVDHEIGIDPEVKSPIAFAGLRRFGVGFAADDWT